MGAGKTICEDGFRVGSSSSDALLSMHWNLLSDHCDSSSLLQLQASKCFPVGSSLAIWVVVEHISTLCAIRKNDHGCG